jgi:hypothetical protein
MAEDADKLGVRLDVRVVVEETDGLVEPLGVLVSVADDVMERVDELVFDTVVEEV